MLMNFVPVVVVVVFAIAVVIAVSISVVAAIVDVVDTIFSVSVGLLDLIHFFCLMIMLASMFCSPSFLTHTHTLSLSLSYTHTHKSAHFIYTKIS